MRRIFQLVIPILVFLGTACALSPSAAEAAGLTWSKPVRVATAPLESLSCPATTFCAAGSSVDVFTTTTPGAAKPLWAAHAAGGSAAPIIGEMATISCAGRSLCVAADFNGPGEAVASTDPLAPGRTHWKQLDDGPPGPFLAYGLLGLSCPTTSLCVGGDGNGGQIETTLHPVSTTDPWSIEEIPHGGYYCYAGGGVQPTMCSSQIDAIDCPSASLCVSMDSSGVLDTSTDPAAAPSVWVRTPLLSDYFAPSYDELAAQMSCPTAGFCAVVFDPTGQVFTSTDPTGGLAAWHATTLKDRYVQAISCASTQLCAAVDAAGYALVSTDPTARTPTWTRTRIDKTKSMNRGFFAPQQSSLTGVACPSVKLCVAVDGFGDELVGRVAG
jgi:hypothetical protein